MIALAEEDHAAQAFFLYGANEPLRKPIQIWRSRREANDTDAFTECDGKFAGVFGKYLISNGLKRTILKVHESKYLILSR